MRRVLVTGSRGFVGRRVMARLAGDGHALTLADRSISQSDLAPEHRVAVGSIGARTDWSEALAGCDTVVHLAAQTTSDRGGQLCDAVNNLGTQALVQQALASGVRTFVLLSSVMAIVDNTAPEIVTDATAARPTTPYGRSKLLAERHVADFASTGRCGVSLRAPLIYGPGAKGNLERLGALARTGLPLPLGAVANRRSLISVANVADAIATVVRMGHEGTSGDFLISDGPAVSTRDIIQNLGSARGGRVRLFRLPPNLLALPLRLTGLGRLADSLLGNLEVDSSRFNRTYAWAPTGHTLTDLRRVEREAG